LFVGAGEDFEVYYFKKEGCYQEQISVTASIKIKKRDL
jgi:hypothetical protein